jgi:hypothetical protein
MQVLVLWKHDRHDEHSKVLGVFPHDDHGIAAARTRAMKEMTFDHDISEEEALRAWEEDPTNNFSSRQPKITTWIFDYDEGMLFIHLEIWDLEDI